MAAIDQATYEKSLTDLKQMVILRQEECVAIQKVVAPATRRNARWSRLITTVVILVGAVVATKGAVELAMAKVALSQQSEMIMQLAFVFMGVAVSAAAALESAFKFDSKADQLRTLDSHCQKFNRTFMTDYKKYVATVDPERTLQRLQLLVESQDDALERVHDQATRLGVDLSSVKVDYRV